MPERYPSKVDWWLALIMILIAIVAIVMPVITLVVAGWRHVIAPLVSAGLMFLVLVGLAWPMIYELGDRELLIRGGLILRIRIPYEAIEGAEFTGNPLSSPALSLARLAITFQKPKGGTSKVMISPPDRLAFLQALAAHTGRHRVEGERLVRT
jgi:hypothetical protein